MFIQKIDFLGSKPEFNILGKSRSQTLFGGILSIIVVCLLALGTYYFVNILFSRKNFTVVSTSAFDDFMVMNLTNPEYAFRLADKLGGSIPDLNRVVGFTGIFWYYKYIVMPDGRTDAKMEVKPFPMERCNSSKHFANSKNPEWKMWRVINDEGACFPKDLGLNATLRYGTLNFTQVSVHVHRCNNKTTNNQCFSREKIDKILEDVLVIMAFRNFYYIHDDFDEPGKEYLQNDVITSSSLLYKKIKYNYQTVKYITDGGFFLPENSVQEFNQLESYRESVQLINQDTTTIPGTITEISLSMTNFRQDYLRKYYKFQNMLADLGGILKGCVSIALVLNWIFCNRNFYNQIINRNCGSYNLSDEEEINSTQNKIITNPITRRSSLNNGEMNMMTPEVSSLNSKKQINKLSNLSGLSSPSKSVNTELKKSKSNRNINSYNNRNLIKTKFLLSCTESFLPLFCFGKNSTSRKNLDLHFKLREIINDQMDIANVIGKLNNIDKFNFLILGSDNKSIINECPNPYISEYKTSLSCKILNAEKIVMDRFKNAA